LHFTNYVFSHLEDFSTEILIRPCYWVQAPLIKSISSEATDCYWDTA